MFWPIVRGQSRFWFSRDFPGRDAALAETFAYYREVMSPGFVDMYFGLAADQVGASLFPIAPEIRQPTLLMWGDRDHGGGMGKGVARLAATIPDVEFVTFGGARHSLEAEVPMELATTIANWPGP
jgi:pimeloyl-ACP methyl ester carboxylesterase